LHLDVLAYLDIGQVIDRFFIAFLVNDERNSDTAFVPFLKVMV
jgi:hypothetical protein